VWAIFANVTDVMPGEPEVDRGDAAVLVRLRGGDEAAFADLIALHHAALLRMARTYTTDAALAEELVQDTWIAFLESLGRFEGRSSIKTWLFRILMNVARARLRKESRTVPLSTVADRDEPAVEPRRFHARWLPGIGGHWSEPPAPWAELPEEQALASETRAAIEAAMAELPEQQRQVMVLRDIEGFAAEEVCNLLGLSDTNQRVLLHRARSKVRRALAPRMGGERGSAP
jgi:RNA polymerase sigma-70 factor (ECF subfamily)